MALAVASTSVASGTDSPSITITKPTGVAVGDLLLIAIVVPNTSGTPTCTGFSICASYLKDNSGGIPDVSVYMLYKIADSGDVSASNYVVDDNVGATSMGVVSMYRITGWSTTNPVYAYTGIGGSGDPVTGASATGLSIQRPSPSLMFLLSGFLSTTFPKSSATHSGYSVTSGVSNPTWTEVQDTIAGTQGNLYNLALAVAYASSSSTTNVTGFDVVISSDTNGSEDGYATMLVVICEPLNQTGTNTLLSVSPTIFTDTAVTVGTTGTNTLLEVSPNLPTQSGDGSVPTVWTTTPKS